MTTIIGISGKKQSGKTSLSDYIKAWHYTENIDSDYSLDQTDDGKVILRASSASENRDITDSEEVKKVLSKYSDKINDYNFADALKQFCINCLGLTHDQCYGSDEDKNSYTPYRWENMPLSVQLNYFQTNIKGYVVNQLWSYALKVLTLGLVDKTIKLKKGSMTAREVMQVFGTNIMRNHFDKDIWVKSTLSKILSDNPDIAIIPDVRFISEAEFVLENDGYLIRLDRSIDEGGEIHESENELDSYTFPPNRSIVISNHEQPIDYKNYRAITWLKDKVLKDN